MRRTEFMERFFVGVTGGQGVGKSTFCKKLKAALTEVTNWEVTIIDGLGAELKRRGVPYGSAATLDGIASAYSIHLRREASAPGGLLILDRCMIDALAYVRCINITSQSMTDLYNDISFLGADTLSIVIHLEMTGRFIETAATHESPELRRCVANEIYRVIEQTGKNAILLNAADDGAAAYAAALIAKEIY